MANLASITAGISSVTIRLCAYVFLQWIPGHHFPPIIITATVIYLASIFGQSEAFGSHRPTLQEAFPAVFNRLQKRDPAQAEEHEAHHEPVLYHDEMSVFQTLLLGVPDWREAEYSYLTIGVNILLALFTLDLVFRGPLFNPADDLRFSRLGCVDSTSAKILIREPDTHALPVYAYVKVASEREWTQADVVYNLAEDTDFTYPLHLTGLSSDTVYDYALSNNLSGTFTTTPTQSNTLTFITSSCIKANFPYTPLTHSLTMHGFTPLSNILSSLPTPASFMLFLGDFIYVDVPLRLGSTIAHYRSEYRRVYASPSWQLPGFSSLPWIHTLDDHEIANDWSSGNTTEPFPAASDPFIHYHTSVNPPIPADAPAENTTYFAFRSGPASFFVLDTRRYRTAPEPEESSVMSSKPGYGSSSNPPSQAPASGPNTQLTHNHTMLGHEQLKSLLAFLAHREDAGVHFKIIASSVPFTKNWRFGATDTWAGFLQERRIVLDAMHAAEKQGVRVVVLSGDRHEFAAIRYPPKSGKHGELDTEHDSDRGTGPHEFSVGPLSMFYLPIRTFKQVDSEDVALDYLPDGNSKVGVVRIAPIAQGRGSVLHYDLYIDGKVAWEYDLENVRPPGWEQDLGIGEDNLVPPPIFA